MTSPIGGPAAALPPGGLVVELGRDVRVRDGGRTLVWGAPARLLHPRAEAAAQLTGRRLRVTGPTSERLAMQMLASGAAHPVIDRLPPTELAEVTVVIPVRDRAPSLDALMSGLGDRIRTIVVDDCSREPRPVAEVATRHRAELVVLPRHRGPAGARNAGLERVTTPFVAFVDSDVTVGPDTIAALLRHFHHPRVAAVAPRILGRAQPGRSNWISRYEDARSSLDRGPAPALVHPRSPVAWLPSACLVARVDALGTGFTDGMQVAEDVDLVWRLAAQGWHVRYEPSATAWHDHRVRLIPWLRRKAFYGSGGRALAERHGAAAAPAVLTPAGAAFVGALLAQRRWSLPAAAVASAVLTVRLRRLTNRSDHPALLAAELAGHDLAAAVRQTNRLMMRHWWPVSLAAALASRRARRAVLLAALTDSALQYRRVPPNLGAARFLVARRLDDLAYGAGLWAGTLAGRSARPLLPAIQP
ncbi:MULTISPECIES: mycofactocin biosynthesis glycosyltransferase MftF [Frankia]|uniref:mycofactocin biosynthesis glycosyltransferase MftF n=1 Tax=Frankia TaxID=1854 RepID=UPI0002E83DA1|nr:MULTISPECIES: mycofactocin biosynthesis glycosyltransferase MftF [Frankia]